MSPNGQLPPSTARFLDSLLTRHFNFDLLVPLPWAVGPPETGIHEAGIIYDSNLELEPFAVFNGVFSMMWTILTSRRQFFMVWIPLINSTIVTFPLDLPGQNVTGLVEGVGFQQAPNLRGTVSIIVSCVTVLIIALYDSFHPDNAENQDWDFSMLFAVVTVLVPEIMIFGSLHDYLTARQHTAHFHDGFKLSRWTHVHSFVLDMKKFYITLPSGSTHEITCRADLSKYIRNGALRNEDLPTASQLKELSKLHILVKIFTMVQVLWLVVQCIARWLSHLPVTLFELMTCCYAICAVLAYVFWIDKPYRVDSRAFIINCSGTENALRNIEFEAEKEDTASGNGDSTPQLFFWVSLALVAFTLSALHFSAWRNYFPTEIEKRLWHITSIFHVSVAGPAVLAVLANKYGSSHHGVLAFLIFPMLSRLILLGLSLASLRALPAGAYIQPAWTNFIPHFS
ncbi:hypothetical protein DL96DRAFT_1757440 [Flagelloscypha sp. PMI_526]|nr:hypothetical protein DL96DRAFT_1757440 [Flagelloscypha sp. PMI_526]